MATPTPDSIAQAKLRYEKRRTSLKGYCLGRGFVDVLRAMTFAEQYHKGFRKDGVTPEFQHQVEIALYATTLKGLTVQEESKLLMIIMLHDVVEDYDVSLDEIKRRFGDEVSFSVGNISKIINGIKKSMALYMDDIARDALAALAKGCDRVHNVQSMRGVFTREKQAKYVKEVRDDFLPMLRKARDLAPQFRQAFNNIKHMLESQVEWVEEILAVPAVNVTIEEIAPVSFTP